MIMALKILKIIHLGSIKCGLFICYEYFLDSPSIFELPRMICNLDCFLEMLGCLETCLWFVWQVVRWNSVCYMFNLYFVFLI